MNIDLHLKIIWIPFLLLAVNLSYQKISNLKCAWRCKNSVGFKLNFIGQILYGIPDTDWIFFNFMTFVEILASPHLFPDARYIYHPQKKLREGNVFTDICLFTGGSHVTITYDALNPPPRHGTWVPTLRLPPPHGNYDLGTYSLAIDIW